MARKKRTKAQLPTPAEMRGVETFDTNEAFILVRGHVESVAAAFKKHKKAKVWQKNVLGETITIADPSFLVLRMAGHPWTLITACVTSRPSFFKPEDAKALSKAMKARAIYFANSDTASYTEYQLFEDGKRLEHFRCFEDVEFSSTARDVEAPEDGPGIYDFVSQFMREEDAFVPACSVHLNTGWMNAGQKVKLGLGDVLNDEAFERIDYVSVGAAR